MVQADKRVLADIEAHPAAATLSTVADRWVLTMTRMLRHPPERVWTYLTQPRLLERWSPIVPDRVLSSIGPALSRETPDQEPVDAEVLVSEAPLKLVHRWGAHVLRWTLEPAGPGSRLTLEHIFDRRAESGSYAAGWHICLAVLAAVLDGNQVERVVGSRALDYGWSGLRDRYEAAGSSATPSRVGHA
jgi:uncharacterized protein YndB with AHSA1/START domain